MVQGLDVPVVADEFGKLGRDGLPGGQAGDGVDRLDGGLAGLVIGASALDLDGLAGSGKRRLFTVASLIWRISERPWSIPRVRPCGIYLQGRDLSYRRTFFWLPLTITM
ncbi:hypothetical protein AB0D59_43135 [Streptomyces sp. NPDC048417]|uniref:hypothetical protein n=1 Tax=Streptomyces sp. NPDC048417 TaxID=3155387 RepID=UPI00342B2162